MTAVLIIVISVYNSIQPVVEKVYFSSFAACESAAPAIEAQLETVIATTVWGIDIAPSVSVACYEEAEAE